jgi:hypothetical protein
MAVAVPAVVAIFALLPMALFEWLEQTWIKPLRENRR